MKPRVKPVDLFSSLKLELSALIVIATAIAFAMCWFLLKFGWSGWIAMPLTLVVALGITYFFSRGITAPLRQMRDVAEAWRMAITRSAWISIRIVMTSRQAGSLVQRDGRRTRACR